MKHFTGKSDQVKIPTMLKKKTGGQMQKDIPCECELFRKQK